MAIHPVREALLIVDLQRDFLPGGALAVAGGDAVVAPIAALAPRFATVVATQDWHPPGHVSFASAHPGAAPYTTIARTVGKQELWPDHCVRGTPGAALHPALPDTAVALVLRKGLRQDTDSYSAFRENTGPDLSRANTGLAAFLKARGVRHVYVCGLARDFCVHFSAVDGAAEGLTVTVLDDLTRAVFPGRAAETDAAFEAAGVRRATSDQLG